MPVAVFDAECKAASEAAAASADDETNATFLSKPTAPDQDSGRFGASFKAAAATRASAAAAMLEVFLGLPAAATAGFEGCMTGGHAQCVLLRTDKEARL